MSYDDDEIGACDLPENTEQEIITKIEAMATEIRNDWTDPRSQCRAIWALCKKLREMTNKAT